MNHQKHWQALQLFAQEAASATGETSADAGQRLRELGIPEEKIRKHRARCICQGKVDTLKHHSSRSPVRSCTELGFYSPRRLQDACY